VAYFEGGRRVAGRSAGGQVGRFEGVDVGWGVFGAVSEVVL